MIVQVIFDTGEGVLIYLVDVKSNGEVIQNLKKMHGKYANTVECPAEIEKLIYEIEEIPDIHKIYDSTDFENPNVELNGEIIEFVVCTGMMP